MIVFYLAIFQLSMLGTHPYLHSITIRRIYNLLSSSTIVIVVLLGFPKITPLGNPSMIMRSKVSLNSNILLSIIVTLIVAVVCPGDISILYGPEI